MAVKSENTPESRGSTRIREFGKNKVKYKKTRESQVNMYPAPQDMTHPPQGGFAAQHGYIQSITWRN